jgi:hypothetical protein
LVENTAMALARTSTYNHFTARLGVYLYATPTRRCLEPSLIMMPINNLM